MTFIEETNRYLQTSNEQSLSIFGDVSSLDEYLLTLSWHARIQLLNIGEHSKQRH